MAMMMEPNGREEQKYQVPAEADEQQLWTELTASAWGDAINGKQSVFYELYEDTKKMVSDAVRTGGFDCLIDVGCGTGDIIGCLNELDVPKFGIDINPKFIEECKIRYGAEKVNWEVVDATKLQEWWTKKLQSNGLNFKKPYIICCNNTMGIIPLELRKAFVDEMQGVCGSEGRCVLTYWNGNFFPCAIKDFYLRNPALCGRFEVCLPYVDFRGRQLHTLSGYKSDWMIPEEIVDQYTTFGITLTSMPPVAADPKKRTFPNPSMMNYVQENIMGIYVVIDGSKAIAPAVGQQ